MVMEAVGAIVEVVVVTKVVVLAVVVGICIFVLIMRGRRRMKIRGNNC